MSDLIRRDEALAGILNHYECNNEIQNKEMDYCFDMLNSLRSVDAVEVTYCDQCDIHGHCITEDTFRLVGVEKPFCCIGGRGEENAVD